jgi:hypothetical protein
LDAEFARDIRGQTTVGRAGEDSEFFRHRSSPVCAPLIRSPIGSPVRPMNCVSSRHKNRLAAAVADD